MKWFTLNFEGESQAEIDFLGNKVEAWDSSVTYGQEVLSWWNRVGDDKSIIIDSKWWEHLRFLNIGNRFKQGFEDNQGIMKDLRRMFSSQNDKLSYYDLFHFIDKSLNFDIEPWEASALEHRLDRLGMAFIEFNEFNEFC